MRVSLSFAGQTGITRRVSLGLTAFVHADQSEELNVVLPEGRHPAMLPGWVASEGTEGSWIQKCPCSRIASGATLRWKRQAYACRFPAIAKGGLGSLTSPS